MIHKMSSHDFNTILERSEKKIADMNNSISNIKRNIDKKLLIIEHENEYLNDCMTKMLFKQQETSENFMDNNSSFILLNESYKGLYESYSNVVHAYFKKEPLNIFNLKSITNPKPYFRDEVKVSINDITTDYYKTILMADNHDNKEIFFEEFVSKSIIDKNTNGESYISKNNEIVLSIEVDKKKVIGVSKFNMIEIDPYLYKSFDIEKIEVFGEDDSKPLYISPKMEQVGKTRVILDKKYNFKKVIFTMTPKYSILKDGEEIIPFGLKHIYFYEADFRNDSYIVIRYESENFIDHIKNDIKVVTPYSTYVSSLKEQGIKIFLEEKDGVLENEQEPSQNIKKPIARNLKKIYFRVPIGNNIEGNDLYRDSLIALKLYIEKR